MNKRTFQDLERAEIILTKKVEEMTNSLRSTFESYDITIRKLSERRYVNVATDILILKCRNYTDNRFGKE